MQAAAACAHPTRRLNIDDAAWIELLPRRDHSHRPGDANFAIPEPPLKLVLIEDPTARGEGVTGALNHIGFES